jgi:hypothetical protein
VDMIWSLKFLIIIDLNLHTRLNTLDVCDSKNRLAYCALQSIGSSFNTSYMMRNLIDSMISTPKECGIPGT